MSRKFPDKQQSSNLNSKSIYDCNIHEHIQDSSDQALKNLKALHDKELPQSGLHDSNQTASNTPQEKISGDATSQYLKNLQGKKIVVAMSGGVDSCAAALLLQDQGFEIIGVSMQVWDYRKNGGNSKRATCCAPADFDDARKVSEKTGFPFYVFDFEDSFQEAVIKPFIKTYLEGKTPNPCLDCNRKVKFKELRRRAKTLGAEVIATGHYAQIKELGSGKLGLFTAIDKEKDQTYFLYSMTQDDLSRTIFPVGGMVKPQVRSYLAEREFEVATKFESQDICFVSSTVKEFIDTQAKALDIDFQQKKGEIISTTGQSLGSHEGIENFTVGQRKGLGISAASPLYVINIDEESHQVQVGGKEDLKKESFIIEEVNWITETPAINSSIECLAKLRYRHRGEICRVTVLERNRAKVEFLDAWSAVSPGQAAVFYELSSSQEDNSLMVLGGGIISKHYE